MATTGITTTPPIPQIPGGEDHEAARRVEIMPGAGLHRGVVTTQDLVPERVLSIEPRPGRHSQRRGKFHGAQYELPVRDVRVASSVMKGLTHLSRGIDLRLTSNKIAVGLTMLGAVVGAVAARPEAGVRGAFAVGVGAFLAWAMGREIDPDRTLTATVAGLITIAASVVIAAPGLSALFATLAAVRIIARTTGLPPTILDIIGVSGIAAWAAFHPGWVAAVGVAIALIVDDRMTGPGEPAHHWQAWWGAVLGALVAVVAGVRRDAWTAPTAWEWTLVALGMAGALLLIRPTTVTSTGDLTKEPLRADRIRAGRWLAGIVALLATLTEGDLGVASMLGVWSALASGGLVQLTSRRGR